MTAQIPKMTAVIGGGNWGTTLAIHLARCGHQSRLWHHDPKVAAEIQKSRINATYLPDWPLPEGITITGHLEEAFQGADAIVIAVASQFLRPVLRRISSLSWNPKTLWVCATKGLQDDGSRASELIRAELGDRVSNLTILAGPSLADEVLRGLPTAIVAASEDDDAARRAQRLFHGPGFRVYTSRDLIGVELGVSLKNVIAIAAGLAQELRLGHNGYGALLTRGLAEMSRLGLAMGARRDTFLGLAGLGDLVTTCGSPLSRNHQVGRRLAKG
ncbi:MAG: NAD(P)-dependent glycerol-3-phosphate dehydrogenase, partial [Candidatus Eisenbacteria bacterium]|nr:NAD(P)-dependent glycerol-3-phosphate dehydrogenase [Candidatus Eisenbacteria bacterium]